MSRASSALLRGSLGTGLVQVASIGLSFLTAAGLARSLGRDGFGVYSFAMTFSLLLIGPASFGFGPVVTRETAAGIEISAWDRVYGVHRASRRLLWRASAVVLGVMAPIIAVAWVMLGEQTATAFLLAAPLTLLSAEILLARHRLLGLRRVVTAQIAETLMRPSLLLMFIGIAYLSGVPLRDSSGPAIAIVLYTIASVLIWLFLLWQIRSSLRALSPPPEKIYTSDPDWTRAARSLTLTGIARDLNAEAGILLVGALLAPGDVAILRAAQRLAALPTYALTAINLSFQPVAASLFAKGEIAQVEILGVRASRVATLLSLPMVIGFTLVGDRALSLFGEGFSDGWLALVIMSLGHLFNVATGSVGVILVAAKREDDAAKGLVFSCVVTLLATVVGIYAEGLLGASVAIALGLVVWNVALSWFCWERLGILPAAFSWRWLRW